MMIGTATLSLIVLFFYILIVRKKGVFFKISYLIAGLLLIAIMGFFVEPRLAYSATFPWVKLQASDYWQTQRRGANFFNEIDNEERFGSAKKAGIMYIRLDPSKWINPHRNNKVGQFLVNANNEFPVKEDISYLKEILNLAHKYKLPVVLTLHNSPLKVANENHATVNDSTWATFDNQDLIIHFWTKLIYALKGHPAIVGYSLVKRSAPEVDGKIKLQEWYCPGKTCYEEWYQKVKSTPQDMNLFYSKAVKEIRKIDTSIPIIIEAGYTSIPEAFKIITPIDDRNVIYSFDMYQPYSFTSERQFYITGSNDKNKNGPLYPGVNKGGQTLTQEAFWDKNRLYNTLKPVMDWQKKYNIAGNRIMVGEFGGFRDRAGIENYLQDLIDIFNENNWHWAFYSYREDSGHLNNYELGNEVFIGDYYFDRNDNYTIPNYSKTDGNPIWRVIQKGLTNKQ